MVNLFGWEIRRPSAKEELPSFVPPQNDDDGALVVAATGAFGTYVDLDGSIRSEAELVTRYREMLKVPECDSAVDEIVNESIAFEEDVLVEMNLDNVHVSDNIKKIMQQEFSYCLRLLEFNKYAYEIFKHWYVDGRLVYHVLIDEKAPLEGIKELRYVDPRKIRKVREIKKTRIKPGQDSQQQSVQPVITKTVNEYFIFNDKGFNYGSKATGGNSQGLKIAKDSVVYCVSGITDENGTMVLSYLHKAIKVLTQLRTLEDSMIIYRLARAPERRIWYIDVGNLPTMKAEQYVRDIMVKHKNRLIYNAADGSVQSGVKYQHLLEDYWLPRREGGRGTEVTTLPAGQNLGEMDDVNYFHQNFLKALNVPISRLNPENTYNTGRATEITRDELKFNRFISRIRIRFSHLFFSLLEKQLILKGIVTPDDWEEIQHDIKFEFAKDNFFSELKESEIRTQRITQIQQIQDVLGKYYSHVWARKNVLKQTDEEIAEEDALISQENNSGDPRWINPIILQNQEIAQGGEEAPAAGNTPQPGDDDESQEEVEKVRKAILVIDQMKHKPKNQRSMQQQSAYKSAVQIVAKNQDVVRKITSRPL